MKVILLEDVKGLGKKNDLVNASTGYAKNFLYKRKLAIEATPENVNIMKTRQASLKLRKDYEITGATEIKEAIDGKKVVLTAPSGENGKLFGSITTKDIADKLKAEYKVVVDKKKIVLKEHIKSIGDNEIQVKIYPGISAKIIVSVVGD
ncbi:MAG: 50S ribosomal protein L9 [Clostridiales bacterium]|nr:50S ribosomal protein L9 [Clostridiales bacterium]